MKTDSTRRIRIENRTPQAGKTRLRLIVGGTRRAATGTPACTNRTGGPAGYGLRALSLADAACFVRSRRLAPTVFDANAPSRRKNSSIIRASRRAARAQSVKRLGFLPAKPAY